MKGTGLSQSDSGIVPARLGGRWVFRALFCCGCTTFSVYKMLEPLGDSCYFALVAFGVAVVQSMLWVWNGAETLLVVGMRGP